MPRGHWSPSTAAENRSRLLSFGFSLAKDFLKKKKKKGRNEKDSGNDSKLSNEVSLTELKIKRVAGP